MHPSIERGDTGVDVDEGATKALEKLAAKDSRPRYYDAGGINCLD
jgi:hypothetical protein